MALRCRLRDLRKRSGAQKGHLLVVHSDNELSHRGDFPHRARERERGSGRGRIATGALARRLDARERKAVEECAMAVAARELGRAGWDRIVRTAEHQSWDFEATRHGDETARVEVKGSTLPISAIEVTRNERDSAVTFRHSILVLVSEIELDRSVPSARGGKARVVDPWQPSDEDFVAQRYSYQVPDAT